MPQIKFTDTNLKTLSADSTTWFSDPTCKGLQLCVTAGGVKTWYVNKWDSTAQKTRRVKLGQWSAQGKHTAWAKKQVGKTAHDIDEGAVKTRQEREAEAASKAVPPTLREAFELEAVSRLGLDDAFGGPRAEETVQNYRSVLERKLDGLLDTRVDEIDHGEIQRRLDALTKSAPFAAHKLHIALSYARTQALSALNIEHMPFRWPAMKKMPIMRDRKDKDREGKVTLDTSVEWADRWAEIEGVENEHIRLAWMLRWHTGMRGRMLRNLTWADIDLKVGTMLLSTGLKKVKGKRLIAMSARSLSMFTRLHEIKMDDCDWVFPSCRRIDGIRGPLDALDRLPLTAEGDLRHLWNEATQDVDTREMVIRWLCGQNLTGGEAKSLGFYATVPVERQRKVANEISAVIDRRCEVTPTNVVEIGRATA